MFKSIASSSVGTWKPTSLIITYKINSLISLSEAVVDYDEVFVFDEKEDLRNLDEQRSVP